MSMTCGLCGLPIVNDKCPCAPSFEPCVIENVEAVHTEIILSDSVIVWEYGGRDYELGYDMDTNKLVAVRVSGLVAMR